MLILQSQNIDLNNILGLHFFKASDFRLYQLFTYMFMHGGWTHLFFNMFALWMFGTVVENVWGSKRFLFYYIFCGLGAGLCQELAQFVTYSIDNLAAYQSVKTEIGVMSMDTFLNRWTTVGASGAIYGILLAFGMLFPENRIFIFPLPVPIKAKWFVMIYAGLELFMAMSNSGDGVAHIAHLGGMIFGFILIRYWKRHPYSGSGNFGPGKGKQFFDNMRSSWEKRKGQSANTQSGTNNAGAQRHYSDWEYNNRKKREEDEIDIILDKIRKSGYDSLTKEEKQKLFDQKS